MLAPIREWDGVWPSTVTHLRAAMLSADYYGRFGLGSARWLGEKSPLHPDHAIGILNSLRRAIGSRCGSPYPTPAQVPGPVAYASDYLDKVTQRSLRKLMRVGFRPAPVNEPKLAQIIPRTGLSLGAGPGPQTSRLLAVPARHAPRTSLPPRAARLDDVDGRLPNPNESNDTTVLRSRHSGGVDPDADAIVKPTRVALEERAITATKELWVSRPVEEVMTALDPRSWPARSVFFESVEVLRSNTSRLPELGRSWSGNILETFVVNWNTVEVTRFCTELAVDVTVDGSEGRMDYGLVYERSGALIRDDGYLEIRSVPGKPGWTHYFVSKTVWFASDVLNLLTPAVLTLRANEQAAAFLSPIPLM